MSELALSRVEAEQLVCQRYRCGARAAVRFRVLEGDVPIWTRDACELHAELARERTERLVQAPRLAGLPLRILTYRLL